MMLSWLVPPECTEATLYLQHGLKLQQEELVLKQPDDAHVVTATTCPTEAMNVGYCNKCMYGVGEGM